MVTMRFGGAYLRNMNPLFLMCVGVRRMVYNPTGWLAISNPGLYYTYLNWTSAFHFVYPTLIVVTCDRAYLWYIPSGKHSNNRNYSFGRLFSRNHVRRNQREPCLHLWPSN